MSELQTAPPVLRRIGCLIYDALLLLALWFIATLLYLLLAGSELTAVQRHGMQLYLWLISAVYFVWCWRHGGQTLAMQTWRMRLVNRDGQAIRYGQALSRYGWATLSIATLGFGYLWALWDKDGQYLHDRLSGCYLVTHTAKPV